MAQLLIVDDERMVADSLAETLPWVDLNIHHVYTAYSSKEALQILATSPIEVVLTDIRMPGLSGLELIERIRELNQKTKCIIHSGHADFEYAKQAMAFQVSEYLLKPASDEEILEAVNRMLEAYRQETEALYSVESMASAIREQLPVLRSQFLDSLLAGKRWNSYELEGKLNLLRLAFQQDDSISILVVRLEEGFPTSDSQSLTLFEYAVNNIAEETFGEHFDLLSGRDQYNYLVLVAKLKQKKAAEFSELGVNSNASSTLFEQTALQLQENVKAYLKRNISLVMSSWGQFPNDVSPLYQESITIMRRNIGNDRDIFIRMSDKGFTKPYKSLRSLYETPTLNQIMDMGQREAALAKIESITRELEEHWSGSQEHMQEVFLHLGASFTYTAHQNGKPLEDLIGIDYEPFYSRQPFLSIRQLKDWALRVTSKIFDDLNKENLNAKSNTILLIQQFINDRLSEDVSLQAISDHIGMHPAYLSMLFKSQTGENLSEYIIRLKMEKAAMLLKHTNERIYQICASLGYQNPPYLIKLFKKYYGVTPQEYRDGLNGHQ
ncbi:DNA-binding response regulator [Paenibacillus sp. FSL H7-0326]|uniref:response regulator n=1 Tax=Paenibacillus sp. FSL H7-0326 TaxID=1921144 RepID=UPI00096D4E79|nr:response regulator [Paenibacillus sp. FSL H7-0326]OMC65437.1 DNA-binding response regulator [Paenibacillus sp. FSL H7-0326]